MTKYFELSPNEIESLYEFSKNNPYKNITLKYTTDGTQGIGYHLIIKPTDSHKRTDSKDIADFENF